MILNVSDHGFIPTRILKEFRYLPKMSLLKGEVNFLVCSRNFLRIANRFSYKGELDAPTFFENIELFVTAL